MKLRFFISTEEISQSVGIAFTGKSISVFEVVPYTELKGGSLFFIDKASSTMSCTLNGIDGAILIINSQYTEYFDINSLQKNNALCLDPNPKYCFAKVMKFIENKMDREYDRYSYKFSQGSSIGEDARIGDGTIIEPGCFIDHGVNIGRECTIRAGAIIRRNSDIGDYVTVRENSVVGGAGFGVVKDNEGHNYKIPQLGGVKVGDLVEIGAFNTIVSGTIEPTTIGSYSKMSDHIHVAHNCKIGQNCIITACAEISGSVTIGDDVYVGPNASLMNKISVGDRALIGLGAVVTKNVAPDAVIAGNPADSIEKLKEERELFRQIIQEHVTSKK
jgi:UDP-3-O-[3-hydroxymyristoyl] glucosamine N-acyltransferase